MAKPQNDWKSQLANISHDMYNSMSQEERLQLKKEKDEEIRRQQEFSKRQKELWKFLAGYKHNSGVFINNFFRKRDYETYCRDKFHCFDFIIGEITPNVFDDPVFSSRMVKYLSMLDHDFKCAYHPIIPDVVKSIINLAEVLDILPPYTEETILYRGCSTIERNGVNGIVSTTTDYKIAEQFSRGTILKIHVPVGCKHIDVKSIRPKNQQGKDTENEVLLPPCSYEVISETIIKKGNEPNNLTGRTILLEIKVTSLDLLKEFLFVMENPPEEYLKTQMDRKYEEALHILRDYVDKKDKKNKALELK